MKNLAAFTTQAYTSAMSNWTSDKQTEEPKKPKPEPEPVRYKTGYYIAVTALALDCAWRLFKLW